MYRYPFGSVFVASGGFRLADVRVALPQPASGGGLPAPSGSLSNARSVRSTQNHLSRSASPDLLASQQPSTSLSPSHRPRRRGGNGAPRDLRTSSAATGLEFSAASGDRLMHGAGSTLETAARPLRPIQLVPPSASETTMDPLSVVDSLPRSTSPAPALPLPTPTRGADESSMPMLSDNGGEKGKNDGRGHHGHSKKPNLKRVTKRHTTQKWVSEREMHASQAWWRAPGATGAAREHAPSA